MDFRVHDPAWFNDKPFGKIARSLHLNGVGVDYVSDRQLTANLRASNGRVSSAGGRWSAIVVPNTQRMPPETFERLIGLASDGATVIFVGPLPRDVPGASRITEKSARLAAARRRIPFRELADDVYLARAGKGIILQGDDVGALLNAAGVGQSEYKGTMYWDRTSFVIDPEGKLRKIYRKVNPEGHEQVLLDDIKSMQAEGFGAHG